MTQPVCAQKAPYVLELEAGTYWWCACGKSAKQPFCDGSHQDTELRPLKLVLEKPEKVWLCGCKQSKKGAYCDGTHRNL
jgi:CDGSH-type Zn-finger protein